VAIKLKNISKAYNNLMVINNFNIELKNNKIICLFGPSGCGKTTLLNIITGIQG